MPAPTPKTNWLVLLTVGNTVATVIILLVVLVGFRPADSMPSKGTTAGTTTAQASTLTDAQVQQVAAQVIPRGTPALYGDELGISYDEAEKGITVLGQFDSLGSKPIKLEGEKLQRYTNIGMSISCEYCCGAKTMTLPDGNPACGCAHSQAMRGVALYLLDKYGDKLTDQEIFNEVAKWKALSFPQETVKKALAAQTAGSATGGQANALNALPQQQGGC